MPKVLRFHRPTRNSASCAGRSRTSKNKSRRSPPSTKVDCVGAANVFQRLAGENPYGLQLLESLGRKMLAATASAGGH